MSLRRALLMLGLSIVAGGCWAIGAGDTAGKPAPRTCSVDTDCASERHEVCRLADGSGTPVLTGGVPTFDGVCVIPARAGNGEVFLEVRPLVDDQPVTQFGPVRLADGQNQLLTIPAPFAISGTVAYHGTTPPQPVKRAKVKFKLDAPIDGRPLTYETLTDGDDGELPGHFRIRLPPGAYTVLVTPPAQPGGLAPPTERVFPGKVEASRLAEGPNLLLVSSESELVPFSGKAQLTRNGNAVPAAGLKVWAIDASTIDEGAVRPGAAARAMAQPATTGEDGSFTLWLARHHEANEPEGQIHPVRLQFGPGPDAPFPTFLDPTTYKVGSHGWSPTLAGPVARIDAPVKVHGHVFATGRGASSRPVPRARVTFRTVDRASFSYAVTVLADDLGAYTAELFPEVYTAVALSAEQAGLAPSLCPPAPGAGEILPESDGTLDFSCEAQGHLLGVVQEHSNALGEVIVEAVRRKDALVPEELRTRSITDGDGAFALALGRGTYDVTLTPPKASKLPAKLIRGLELGATGASPSVSLVVELDPPFELFGKLFAGAQNHPLAAAIEAYAPNPDGGALLVGQAVSQEDGAYSLVLPAQQP